MVYQLQINHQLISFEKPKIMGILNLTPDSFYENSRVGGDFEHRIEEMVKDGVDIIDIGGYSTRPGAADISTQQEIDRILPVINYLHQHLPEIPISVDTFRTAVAKQAIQAGAGIINDVSGGNLDDQMLDFIGRSNVPYVLTHMRGTPETMTELAKYRNVTVEVIAELQQKGKKLLDARCTNLIIDPGFGFAKNANHNFELLRNLDQFKVFQLPILAGLSRKSMIWRTLNIKPSDALFATGVLETIAVLKGIQILRVHDVKETKQLLNLTERVFPDIFL